MMKQRCSNCKSYPLCEKCEGPTEVCNQWDGRYEEIGGIMGVGAYEQS